MPTRGRPRRFELLTMIANGKTNCEAERNLIAQGFSDILNVLKSAKDVIEMQAKTAIHDIINDKSIDPEERKSIIQPHYDLIKNQEETAIRICRTVLIGLFSFWELSLKDICGNYGFELSEKAVNTKSDKTKYGENDYLNAIFQSKRPQIIGLISSKIKELRNYMTHGSLEKGRQDIIDQLMADNPNFGIIKVQAGYVLNSYDGMENILHAINEGLRIAEMTAKSKELNQK